MNNTFLIEVLPSFLFLLVYNLYSLTYGIAVLIASSLICISYLYLKKGKVSWILIISFLFLSVLGGLTILSGDSIFFKMKPTFVYTTFAIVLFADSIIKKGLLKSLMGSVLKFSDKSFFQFTRHLSYFCIFLAILNETVWRNFPELTWIYFKFFGLPLIIMCFMGVYVPFLIKKEKISLRDS